MKPVPSVRLPEWSPPPASPLLRGGLRGLTARRPLVTFVVMGLSLAYALMLAWGLAYRGVIPGGSLADRLDVAPDELAGLLSVCGLFPSAVFVVWATEGRDGLARLARRMTRWRVGFGWWLVVLTGLPTITTVLALALGDSWRPVAPLPLFVSQLGYLAINLAVINLWEEAAWSGLFMTRLERRHNVYAVAVFSAVPFALAHVPLEFFVGGRVTVGTLVTAFISYFILAALVRPMLATVMRGAADSLLLVALTHSVFNRTNNDNGIVANLVSGDMRLAVMPLAVILLTVVIAIPIRRRLGRGYRLQLDAA